MKLKYKKALLLILLSTMGTGILTLSFSSENSKKEENSTETMSSDPDNTDSDGLDMPSGTPALTPTLSPTPFPTQTPVPTQIPTPTSLPVFALEDDGYPEIEALIKDYYDAKVNCDIKNLKSILSDPADVPSKEQLQADILYIEKYQAINCYIKKSYETGCYIVFAYNEIKFMNIDTPAPAVDRFYLITDNTGNFKIFSGEYKEEVKEYYDARLQDADVLELFHETNAKGEEAKAKDEMLKIFWDGLNATQD